MHSETLSISKGRDATLIWKEKPSTLISVSSLWYCALHESFISIQLCPVENQSTVIYIYIYIYVSGTQNGVP